MIGLIPSPMFGQEMPFFKVEIGPAVNDFKISYIIVSLEETAP